MFNIETNKVIVSRDVVFEENKQREWRKDYEGQLNEELEWEEQEKNEGVEESVHKIGEEKETPRSEGEVECEKTRETSDHKDEEHSDPGDADPHVNQRERGQSSVQGRDQRMPQWMNDYVSGENLSDDEAHMVKDAEAEDPICHVVPAAEHVKLVTDASKVACVYCGGAYLFEDCSANPVLVNYVGNNKYTNPYSNTYKPWLAQPPKIFMEQQPKST
ncbi:hypothetical protein KIW84_032778 [Lathyrus oleraceus]|uniref:Uncharacterized protein n=1 Tax=Pisum sativum TaxID=3888 RepID=A0A9D4XU15_PEA|nr:hypothetical protein KIW84_032778 [Pisum sativum]